MFRRSRPVMMPSARTKKLGKQLWRAAVLLQLIQTWLLVAAACIAAGIRISGKLAPRFSATDRVPTWRWKSLTRRGDACPAWYE